jgi:NAD(P)H-hydrate epimerase
MKVTGVETMRAMDKAAIEKYKIPETLLMENAGGAAAQVILEELQGVSGKRIVVLCGNGNNGGDGLVAARKLHSNGANTRVFILGDPEHYKGAARLNYDIALCLGLPMERLASARDARHAVLHADAIVDAVFGTGLAREVTGLFAEVIRLVNGAGRTVFALDIPSGVNGDTGQVCGVAVKASATVAFGLPKQGNLLYPGYSLCGRLYVTHISFPPELTGADTAEAEVNFPPPLPPRDPAGHKGAFGDALFIAGAGSYLGAPGFAAEAFLRAGGGYARLAAPRSIVPTVAARAPELVFMPQEETPGGALAPGNLEGLLLQAARSDVAVLGPGLSLDPGAQELARRFAALCPKPLVADGDGLTALAAAPEILAGRAAPTVLTPHPGEMARFGGLGEDLIGLVRERARELNATVVLKGAHTLIATPYGRVFINLTGNSGMATAGSGDVLTGTVAAMFCLGLDLPDAARKGVFLHGLAGDLARDALGEDGMCARDLLARLPEAVRLDREGLSGKWRERCSGPRVV